MNQAHRPTVDPGKFLQQPGIYKYAEQVCLVPLVPALVKPSRGASRPRISRIG